MTPFKDQPIARKAATLGLAPAICALIVVSVAFLVSVFISVRRNVAADIATSAAIIADSVNLAVSVNDAETVRELTGALREKRNIDRACVFDANGRFLAGYAATGEQCPATLAIPSRARSAQVTAVQDILIGTRRVGTVRVVGNVDQLYRTLRSQTIVTIVALAVAIAIAWLLVGRLQRAIAGPIGELAATADHVSVTGDYGIRAAQTTGDEVGSLVQSFNTMLTAVQRSEAERSRLLDRERQASRLKDEFLAAVSHELRTPLNAILGWTHILTTTSPSPEMLDKGLKTLHRNAKAQTRLIEDLIEVSRAATGKLNLKLEVVDLRDLVKQSVDGLQASAAAKPVALEISLQARHALVSGDRDRLQQIVANLVMNAIKFTPAGGAVSVSLAAADGDYILRVRDTGIGIPAEFLPYVFDRFRQADGSTTREYGGLGLGLSIVHDLVHLHRGSVTAQSAGKGTGAEFVVRLPRLVDAPISAAATVAKEPHPDLRGWRVLAVDDNQDALDVLSVTLTRAGALVRACSSGAAAIAEWTRDPADVIVCDLGMPGMDGFEVLRRIRELDALNGRRTFAVAVTAYASADYVRRTRDAGFDAHVTKPYDTDVLLREIALANVGSEGVGRSD